MGEGNEMRSNVLDIEVKDDFDVDDIWESVIWPLIYLN